MAPSWPFAASKTDDRANEAADSAAKTDGDKFPKATMVTEVGAKRKRSDDDDGEEGTRRVLQRTDDTSAAVSDIKTFVKTMVLYNDQAILNECMKGLAKCLFDEKSRIENQPTFLRVGGPVAVVGAMENHPNCEGLQRRGIEILLSALWNNAELKSVVVEVDGVQAFLAAMQKFHSRRGIQLQGLRALSNLSSQSACAKVLVQETDTVTLVINTMKTFQDSVDIVRKGCKVIFKLALVEDNKKPLRDANVATAVAAAIDGHKSEQDIQKYGWGAIKRL